jgi:cytochrome b561
MIRGDREHWGSLAKFFHWAIVACILAQATIGLTMVNMAKSPKVIPYYTFHKSLGLTIFALAVLRLAWKLFDKRPDEPATMPRWNVTGAKVGHALLYVLLFLVPLSGWWYDSVAALRPLYFWGLFEVPHLGAPDPTIPDLKEIAAARHLYLFWTLAAVAAGHALIALYHQFVSKDGVLARMWPDSLQRRRPSPPSVSPEPTLPELTDEPTPDNPVAGNHVIAVHPAADHGQRA